MVHFFIGTKAQFIKMAPVMVQMRDRGLAFRYVDSGQHAELTRSLRRVFGLGEPDFSLRGQAGDIVSIPSAVAWYAGNSLRSLLRRRWLREAVFPGGGVCLIHGDTLSTLLGMKMARRAGLDIAHVEAGLRSFRLLDPFPEEIIRIRCMRRSQVLFAPSAKAAENLRAMNLRGRIVEAGGNTVADALRLMADAPTTVPVPEGPFALATCHRLETITSKARLSQVIDLINRAAERMAVVFVTHKPTRRHLEKFGLTERISPNVTRLGMLDYGDFVVMLKATRMVLTDGGSIQEECAYLGKPCLVMRRTTERPDGIGRNATIWGFDDRTAERFLDEAARAQPPDLADLPRPSAKIVDTLVEMGYCGP